VSEPPKNRDLHGFVPDECPVALLLVDVINDLEFEGGEVLLPHARRMAKRIAALKQRLAEAGIPTIYANDNFGRWRSDFKSIVQRCLGDVRGRPVAELLRPGEDDYFVLKPKYSGFYSTSLDVLLDCLGVRVLIIAGMATEMCVQFTAHDAFMRDYQLFVPEDCVASETPDRASQALEQMRRVLEVDTSPSDRLDISHLLAIGVSHGGKHGQRTST
jgi:nicotinamidase-related amidase